MSAVCSSCGAPIRWALSEKSKRIPLDAAPVEDGNIILEDGIARYITLTDAVPFLLYKSHFATCVNADQHRKRR